jgi:hypothetical protein
LVDALLKYVEDQMAKGYNPQVIKDALVRQGYSPALVDGVIESVSMRQASEASPQVMGSSQEKRAFPKLILILLFLGIVIAGIIFVPGLIRGKEPLLDITASSDKYTYAPGEELGFDVEIYNMGSAERFDINLMYRVLDQNDNAVLSKEKTVAISTSTSHHLSLTLPANINPGDYTLKVFANYAGKVATSSFTFKVKEKTAVAANCNDNIKNQDEVGVDCGGVCGGYWYDNSCHSTPKTNENETLIVETCNDGKQNQDETGIDCGGRCGGYWYDSSCHSSPQGGTTTTKLGYAETMIKVNTLAVNNPEEAKALCLELEKSFEKDSCFNKVAQASMQNEYCTQIIETSTKDECYYYFYAHGDYSVCEKLTDAKSKDYCEQLREMDLIKEQLEAGNNETVINTTTNSTAFDYFND